MKKLTIVFSILFSSYNAGAQTDWTPTNKAGNIVMTGASSSNFDIDISRANNGDAGVKVFNSSWTGRSILMFGQGLGGKYGYAAHHSQTYAAAAGYTQTYKPSSTVLVGSDVNGLGFISTQDIRFSSGGDDDTKQRMIINGVGNVGIGITNP